MISPFCISSAAGEKKIDEDQSREASAACSPEVPGSHFLSCHYSSLQEAVFLEIAVIFLKGVSLTWLNEQIS